jgi:hypothetical protein
MRKNVQEGIWKYWVSVLRYVRDRMLGIRRVILMGIKHRYLVFRLAEDKIVKKIDSGQLKVYWQKSNSPVWNHVSK